MIGFSGATDDLRRYTLMVRRLSPFSPRARRRRSLGTMKPLRPGLIALIALLTTPAASRLLLPASGVSVSRTALARLRGGAAQLAGGSSTPARCTLPWAAYPAVGRTGHFDNTRKEKYWLNKEDKPAEGSEDNPIETWVLACGLGWLYGLGCVVGPFFGVGVGVVFPGGVIAGAGAGVGLVIGIGMGGGAVWGSGRGAVQGFKVGVPMAPPKVPEPREIAARARAGIDALSNARQLARERLRAARTRRTESGRRPSQDEL